MPSDVPELQKPSESEQLGARGPVKMSRPLPWRVVQWVGASSHTPKGWGFGFRLGHTPRLQV